MGSTLFDSPRVFLHPQWLMFFFVPRGFGSPPSGQRHEEGPVCRVALAARKHVVRSTGLSLDGFP